METTLYIPFLCGGNEAEEAVEKYIVPIELLVFAKTMKGRSHVIRAEV